MEATVFTPAQQHLLRLMSYVKTPEAMRELEEVLSNHYAKRVDEEMDQLIDCGEITPEVIEEWGKEHMRTPYL